ncbi:unnamed protein product [Cylicocyclus nassatus]|uniref:Uncharacterized protein n=1 Tax=Cylicocyclus nassatus TaxID=53992 RepID=A0AA36GK84_CYLNA|nr:unnamed protein product [Cylicocyclus nassatus]
MARRSGQSPRDYVSVLGKVSNVSNIDRIERVDNDATRVKRELLGCKIRYEKSDNVAVRLIKLWELRLLEKHLAWGRALLEVSHNKENSELGNVEPWRALLAVRHDLPVAKAGGHGS